MEQRNAVVFFFCLFCLICSTISSKRGREKGMNRQCCTHDKIKTSRRGQGFNSGAHMSTCNHYKILRLLIITVIIIVMIIVTVFTFKCAAVSGVCAEVYRKVNPHFLTFNFKTFVLSVLKSKTEKRMSNKMSAIEFALLTERLSDKANISR